VILTGSLLASLGSGTVTSTTPSRVDTLIFLASTPEQRHRAPEGRVAALAPNVVLFPVLRVLLVLTGDREDVVVVLGLDLTLGTTRLLFDPEVCTVSVSRSSGWAIRADPRLRP
jgi:hypothetical protein